MTAAGENHVTRLTVLERSDDGRMVRWRGRIDPHRVGHIELAEPALLNVANVASRRSEMHWGEQTSLKTTGMKLLSVLSQRRSVKVKCGNCVRILLHAQDYFLFLLGVRQQKLVDPGMQ